ncbi:histidine phosphatase family protein [Aeromicrobium chenweiae]|uniref:Histidine phosphatase family protein n=1 Tax=Aeromicrobium chenweiae TaxID=2079793 RepID=A0A2S0WRL2_9ACTN|nr:histidine phosphatase family protein [Aeromicrobium chenweiae]AWB93874.1 histidine phosphatase family protein [Aeromicrobium chenweiae]TGN30919.1 histidine phosphatase family protein [Aeromicrobium chenweiae]
MGSIHLIRHGQASWGSDDYDQLSELGAEQSAALGMSWEASGWAPTAAVAGGMKRHAQTAISTIDASGQGDGYDVDPGWDEYDHLALARAHDPAALAGDAKAFQASLNVALEAWRAGESGAGESFEDFRRRVLGSFERVVAQAGSGQRIAVFTSGGPIALVVSHLLAGDDSHFQVLNDVVINASVTTVIVGQTGARLLAFNEHGHLPHDMVTFR